MSYGTVCMLAKKTAIRKHTMACKDACKEDGQAMLLELAKSETKQVHEGLKEALEENKKLREEFDELNEAACNLVVQRDIAVGMASTLRQYKDQSPDTVLQKIIRMAACDIEPQAPYVPPKKLSDKYCFKATKRGE